ncbi:DNA binding [Euphorbia peplus]|nr:DNA binding [Euphorbia peplus]
MSVDDPYLLSNRAVPAKEEDKLAGSENNEATNLINNSFVEKGSSERLQHTGVKGLYFSAPSKHKAIHVPLPKDSQSVHDLDLCAPDTLEFEEDNSANSAPTTLIENNFGIKEDITLTNVVVLEDLENKSHRGEETCTSNLNVNSERSDFDSIDHDITKSMMSFLLPQAIPLLKGTSSKKKKAISSSGKLPTPNVVENTEHGFFVDAQFPGVDHSVVKGTGNTSSISVEKSDGGKKGDHLVNLSTSFSSKPEPSQSCLNKAEYCPNVGGEFTCIDVKESLDCHARTSRSKNALNDDKGPCAAGARDVTVGTMVSPALSSMDTLTEDGASNMKIISSSEVSKKVYTRKKVLRTESMAGKCHPPLVEELQMSFIVDEPHKKGGSVNCIESSFIHPTKCFAKEMTSTKDIQGSSELMMQQDLELYDELEGMVDFLGCYCHPTPVLSLVLRRKGIEIFIYVLCGLLVDESRTLFVYKLVTEDPRAGCPLFVGHTMVTWPSSTSVFGKEIALESSGLQITPDGQCLVLLGSIRTPYCWEGKLNCMCSACTSDHFENKAVKIVQLKAGYVSVLSKLETTDRLQCILVFEPDHLIAAGENRRLHLWTMNSRWSAPTEEFVIESNDYICPCIVEMKRIPKFDAFVIEHNGSGEFTLWDISKRIFISRFSAPSTSVHQFFPISLFSWQTETHSFRNSNVEAQVNRLMDATKIHFSQHSKNHSFSSLEIEDIGIWFIVSSAWDTDCQHDFASRDCQTSPAGWWRLALLVKNTLILGSALDPRAAAIGTSSGEGIMGTHDGLVYMGSIDWEKTWNPA